MRLDNEKPDYDSIEDRRGQGGGMGFPGGGRGGRGVNIPIGMGRGGFSFKTIIFLVIVSSGVSRAPRRRGSHCA